MQITQFLSLTVLAAMSVTAHGESVTQKGKATVGYVGKAASTAIKTDALFKAEMKAVDAYYADLGDAATEAQDAVVDQIKADPDRYILNVETLDEQDVPASHQYTIVVRVSLNAPRLRLLLKQKGSADVANAAATRSTIGFVFLSRAVESTTVYDARVSKRVDTSANVDAKQSSKDKLTLDGMNNQSLSGSGNTSVSVETGGTTTQKSATASYQIIPSSNLNQVVSKEFTGAGYQITEAALIEPSTQGRLKVADIEKDYASGNDLRSDTLNNVVQGSRIAGLRYFALATLDVGQVRKDPATGFPQIGVTVNAKILDVGAGIPRPVAVAGPTQFSATGPSEDEARTSALKLAAQSTARELTTQLTTLGIH